MKDEVGIRCAPPNTHKTRAGARAEFGMHFKFRIPNSEFRTLVGV